MVTTPNGVSFNAHRPFITKVGNKLYISYDVSEYIYPTEQKNWQAHVNVYQISNTTEVNQLTENWQNSIFQNPSSGKFTISGKGELSIYDLSG